MRDRLKRKRQLDDTWIKSKARETVMDTSIRHIQHSHERPVAMLGAVLAIWVAITVSGSALASALDLSNTSDKTVTSGSLTASNNENAIDADNAGELTLTVDKNIDGSNKPTISASDIKDSKFRILDTGSITGTQEGIRINSATNLTIDNKGTIKGKNKTIDLQSSVGTSIVNSGTIKTTNGNHTVMLVKSSDGSVLNTGIIESNGDNAVNIGGNNGQTLIRSKSMTVTNSDTIEADGNNGIRGTYAENAIIENTATGTIKATEDAVDLGDSIGSTLINKGLIESSEDDGVDVDHAEKLTIRNTGIIRAGDGNSSDMDDGIEADDVSQTTITNDGTIVADNNGIDLGGAKDSVLRNSGTIRARNDDGVDIGSSTNLTLQNTGMIKAVDADAVDADNVDGAKVINIGTIQANGNDALELDSATNTTITNAGTIEAGSEAIDGSGSDKLVVDNSGVIRAAQNTIRLNDNSTLTNTGQVVASDNNANAIVVDGTGTTVTLEEGSEVIGGIKTTQAGNTLEIDVGSARSVVYETNGDWELTFADDRPGIEGSVVTAGIGQLETSDELMHRHFADLRDSLKRLESTDEPTTNPIQVDAYRGREKREAGQDGTSLEKYELRTTALTLALPMRVLDIAQPYANYSESALDIDGNAHQIDVQSVRLGLRQPALLTMGKLNIGGRIAIGRNFHDGDREVLVNNNGASGTERQTTSWRSDIAELALNAEYHQTIAPSIQLRINPEVAAQHQRIEAYRESEAFFWKKRSLTQAHAALALGIDYAAEPDTTLSVEARGWHRELLSGETADYRLNTTDVSYTDPTTSDQGLEVSIGLSQQPSDNVRIQAHLTGHRSDTGTDGAIGSLTLQRRF
jgi:hypothetical protein